jgi:hypothetical protein
MSNEVQQTVSSENNGSAMSNDGIRYTPAGAGIKIDDSSGNTEILITQILSAQALYGSLTVKASGETISNAGALLYEDGVPFAWNPVHPNSGQGATLSTAQLSQTSRITTKTIAFCPVYMLGGLKSKCNS